MDAVSFSDATIALSGATQSPAAIEWLTTVRKLSLATLAKLPVGSGTVYFPELHCKSQAVFFKYTEGWKAHAFPEKAFVSKPGTAPEFWNLAAVLNGPLETVYIVEGELDACALVESGIEADTVLAAPSAPPPPNPGETPPDTTLEYVNEALAAGLNRAKRFVWCGDQDGAGLALRKLMARLLGVARFYFIDWPEGSKDANDHLRTDGPVAVLELVRDGTHPWPAQGLFRLFDLPDAKPLTIWRPGFDDVDFAWGDRLLLAAGTLSVVTGHPGHGKTLLWGQIWQQIVMRHNLIACIASFETRPKPHLRRQLRTLHGRLLERNLDRDRVAAADRWINEHYLWLVHPDRRPTLSWLLQQAEIAVIRHGAKIVQVDPWNRLEADREPRETETDYIGRCLRELYNFAIDFDCHVQILAHPSKLDGYRRGGAPELEDIAGSKHWDNMVDQGFVVHRPRLFDDEGKLDPYTELYHKKARFDELGHATKFGMLYDTDMGRYGTCALRKKRAKKIEDAAIENENPEPLPPTQGTLNV